MPPAMAGPGGSATIKKITGKDDTMRFLNRLGFTGPPRYSDAAGNLILNVKDTRVAGQAAFQPHHHMKIRDKRRPHNAIEGSALRQHVIMRGYGLSVRKVDTAFVLAE